MFIHTILRKFQLTNLGLELKDLHENKNALNLNFKGAYYAMS